MRENTYIHMNIDWENIVIEGNYAWSMGTYKQVFFNHKNGGNAKIFRGKFLTVFHRQPDGSWKICRDCFNSNDPPSI